MKVEGCIRTYGGSRQHMYYMALLIILENRPQDNLKVHISTAAGMTENVIHSKRISENIN